MITTGYGLSDVELVAGTVFGPDPGTAPLLDDADALAPLEAFERVILRALGRPPCVMSFSGGRDSSALLSVAARLAAREGLPPPVPVTLRVVGSQEAEESEWQEMVLRRLGLDEWVRIDVSEELDVVGPLALGILRRHGLLWPFNTHFHLPIFDVARGGTVVTGFGGDELGLSNSTARAERIIAGRRLRRPVDVLVTGLALSPRPLRQRVLARRERHQLRSRVWLTAEGILRAARAAAAAEARHPLGWDRLVREAFWPSRYLQVTRRSFEVAAAPFSATVVHPFAEPEVLTSLGKAGGFAGFGSRTALMAAVFGDLLPSQTTSRVSKATFDRALWKVPARDFARRWSGLGLPEKLVHPDRVRDEWLSERPHPGSALLVQAAWLHDHRASVAPASDRP